MKKSITILALAVLLTLNLSANSINNDHKGIEENFLLENTKIDIIVDDADVLAFFTDVQFNESRDRIKFKSIVTIESIKVVNADNDVEYALPIGGNTLNLSIKDFTMGNYSLEIVFEGDEKVYQTGFNKKY